MNTDTHKQPDAEGPRSAAASPPGEKVLKCEDIQELLLAYMSRELGDAQSLFIREHIRKCDDCRAEAAEIETTLALLRRGSEEDSEGARLTDERRKRILRAVFHPVIDWIDVHHRLVSIVLAVLVLVVAFVAVRHVELFKYEPPEEGIPIWQIFKSGRLPELVEQERQRQADEDAADGENAP